MQILCTPNSSLNNSNSQLSNTIAVNLYGLQDGNVAGIGRRLIHAVETWGSQPTQLAWDFLSIALGIISADTFVKRSSAADGWTRELLLTVAVHNPDIWQSSIVELERTLRFLSGDHWSINITGEGEVVPQVKRPQLFAEDSVCLFSGGLDSLVGCLNLCSMGKLPIIVSHAYPKDRKVQVELSKRINDTRLKHFIENVDPHWVGDNETSMRTRSILFLAFGILVSSGLIVDNKTLYIPENGFISLNVPLSTRRIASLSTKTTHPYFISQIQNIITRVGMDILIENPYKFKTKGEMLLECINQQLLKSLAPATVSCGKWKRINMQCGKCVPCIIRRAAFKASGLVDETPYSTEDIKRALIHSTTQDFDDLKSVLFAIDNSQCANIKRWVLRSAPLRFNIHALRAYIDVFRRGLDEINNFIN